MASWLACNCQKTPLLHSSIYRCLGYAVTTVVSSRSSDNVSSLLSVLKYNSGNVLQIAKN